MLGADRLDEPGSGGDGKTGQRSEGVGGASDVDDLVWKMFDDRWMHPRGWSVGRRIL